MPANQIFVSMAHHEGFYEPTVNAACKPPSRIFVFFWFSIFNISSTEILNSNTGQLTASLTSRPHAAPIELLGRDFLLVRVLQRVRCCGLLQYSLPRDSADGEHQSCAWHIRTARMWVEVISNEFCLIYGTNAFSASHESSLSIHGAIERSPSLFKFPFFPPPRL